jgi:hypothetical protein
LIITYETFTDIAHVFIDGTNLSHTMSDHTSAECLGWQKGVIEFAKALDEGYILAEKP